jgi:hypothetical protein
MTCHNPNHHQSNGEPCVGGPHQPSHMGQEYQRCSMTHMGQNNFGYNPHNGHTAHNPHDMHYHINKVSLRNWSMNFAYLALHAVEIYLIIKLV